MAELRLRLNLDSEEVELVVDGQVALTSGSDVLASWVQAINDKHKPVEEEKKVAEEVATEVDTGSEPVLD